MTQAASAAILSIAFLVVGEYSLALLAAVGFALTLWLLRRRWINPDTRPWLERRSR